MTLHSSAVELLTAWAPPDAAQDALRHCVLAFLDAEEDACLRRCVPGHITASAIVVDDAGEKVLLTLHPRIRRWVQLGGHCEESDRDILAAAFREATEESGISGLRIDPDLASIHVHPITCSLGVPTRHLDLQFVAYAPPRAVIEISDESLDLRWWDFDELPAGTDAALLALIGHARSRASQMSLE